MPACTGATSRACAPREFVCQVGELGRCRGAAGIPGFLEGGLAEEFAGKGAAGAPPDGEGPNHPSRRHVRWYAEQMIRWGHLETRPGREADLSRICLEEFHRQALAGAA